MKKPSARILQAFQITGAPVLLRGGRGSTYRAGATVLKPDEFTKEEAEWIAGVYETITQEGFCVPTPIRTIDGSVLCEGWSAWEYVNAQHEKGRWNDVFTTFDAFHFALRRFARPPFLDSISSPWIIADRKVWGDIAMEYDDHFSKPVETLITLLKPVDLPSQVIHGDFGEGNMLFAQDGGTPYVIDFSPYFRPVGFARAVVVVDAIVWSNAPSSIIRYIEKESEYKQLLVRAALRRILELERFYCLGRLDLLDEVSRYSEVIQLIQDLTH